MKNKNRFILSEDDSDIDNLVIEVPPVELDSIEGLPVDDIIVDEIPSEPTKDIAINAYTDMLQDLLRKQWDVINSADSIMATIENENAVNKDDVTAILKKLVDDTTVAIGMVTKALGVIDPSQEELMNQGVAKAEEVISQETIEESVEKPLVEDASAWKAVDFSDSEYYDRFWEEECFYQLQYFWENAEDYADDEDIQELDNLSADEIKDIVKDAAQEVRNSDYLWEEINERIQDEVQDALSCHLQELRDTPTVEIGSGEVGEINIEGNIEGE